MKEVLTRGEMFIKKSLCVVIVVTDVCSLVPWLNSNLLYSRGSTRKHFRTFHASHTKSLYESEKGLSTVPLYAHPSLSVINLLSN